MDSNKDIHFIKIINADVYITLSELAAKFGGLSSARQAQLFNFIMEDLIKNVVANIKCNWLI